MNVILDTNTLVSGLFFKGKPRRILTAWRSGQFVLFASTEIFDEYARVIRELSHLKPRFNPEKASVFLHKNLRFLKPVHLPHQICSDGDDDKFIACALPIMAIIVTGDKALLKTSGYKGLVVLTPAEFERQYLI
ncbi:MAG: putative toxin-antitoxin system toxin component, PIN family [Candidatus Omnitrophica bacterium]|nr:putative toxin-antitoxin system toxin component, PIN family [Candidatus Omnitrophota bacterium]